MSFYEFIIIIRQVVSSADVDKIVNDFTKLVENHEGQVVKTEYWGIRPLAYEIKNNSKGHYYFMGIKVSREALSEIDRKIKLSESIIRSSLVKVNEIDNVPSPLLKTKDTDDTEEAVDVTINSDAA